MLDSGNELRKIDTVVLILSNCNFRMKVCSLVVYIHQQNCHNITYLLTFVTTEAQNRSFLNCKYVVLFHQNLY